MILSETEREMILSALDAQAIKYDGIYASVSPPLAGLKKVAQMHRALGRKLTRHWSSADV